MVFKKILVLRNKSLKHLAFNQRIVILAVGFVIPIIIAFQLPPIAQPITYHDFVDNRKLLGITNFWNVASNLLFLILSFIGLRQLWAVKGSIIYKDFFYYWNIIFISVALIFIGSMFYHLNPNNSTLVWDRLPIALVFMSFFAFIIAERVNKVLGFILLHIFLLLGISSVFYWSFTETAGAGDLRFYGLVQFLPVVEIPLICFLFSIKEREIKFLIHAFSWYILAKAFEFFDKIVFSLAAKQMGGHALKHFAATMALYALYKYAFKIK